MVASLLTNLEPDAMNNKKTKDVDIFGALVFLLKSFPAIDFSVKDQAYPVGRYVSISKYRGTPM